MLTIGIPTYKRPAKLAELLERLFAAPQERLISVMVLDDGDPPAAAAVCEVYRNRTNFRSISNNKNIGYAKSLLRLADECKTPYLMVLADDDHVEMTSIQPILKTLEQKNPSFLCPIYRMGNKIYRGFSDRATILPGEYFSAAAHAPGLVYEARKLAEFGSQLRQMVEAGNSAAILYPQVLFAIKMILEGENVRYCPEVAAFDNGNLESDLTDTGDRPYWKLASRIQQFADFDNFIAGCPARSALTRSEMQAAHRTLFMTMVLYAWGQEDAKALRKFQKRAAMNYLRGVAKRLIKSV